VIVAVPAPTAVTGTLTLVTPTANVTVAGTFATPVLLELRLAVSPALAAPDRFSVRVPLPPALRLRLDGENELVPPLDTTCTCVLAGVYPVAVAVIVAVEDRLIPVTCGAVAGLVAPPAMNTLEVTVTFEVSLVVSTTVTPPDGAAEDRLNAKLADCPTPTMTFAGRLIAAGCVTLTAAVALAMLLALAVIVTAPTATPVTGTLALVEPAANTAVGATDATAGLLELKFTVRPPAGAPLDNSSVRYPVAVPFTVRLPGEKFMLRLGADTPTCTCPEADGNPAADTVMVAVPAPTPVTVTGIAGVVVPCAKYALLETVTFEASLLASVRNTPPAPAAEASVTGYCVDCPTPNDMLAGTWIGAVPPEDVLLTTTATVAVEVPELLIAVKV
jgi:hypothetical protein